MSDYVKDKIDEVASKIASKANECCYRSDGYEEDVRKYAIDILNPIIDDIIKVYMS